MNLRNIPKTKMSTKEIKLLIRSTSEQQLRYDTESKNCKSLIEELKAEIVSRKWKIRVGKLIHAFHCDADRLQYLDGDESLANNAIIEEIYVNTLDRKPALRIRYLTGTHEGKYFDIYQYWELIKE
jgi:hypothetical protein